METRGGFSPPGSVNDTPDPSPLSQQVDTLRTNYVSPLSSFSPPSIYSMETSYGLSSFLDPILSADTPVSCRSTGSLELGIQLPFSNYEIPLFSNTPFDLLVEKIPNVSFISVVDSPIFPEILVKCVAPDDHQRFTVTALLDTGAGGSYVDISLVEKHDLQLIPVDMPLIVHNADGSQNKHGTITHCVNLLVQIGEHRERLVFNVTRLGKKSMIIGITWFKEHNPEVDWTSGSINFSRCPSSCGARREFIRLLQPRAEQGAIPLTPEIAQGSVPLTPETETDEEDDFTTHLDLPPPPSFAFELDKEDYQEDSINLVGISTRLAIEATQSQKHLTLDDIRKGPYAEYEDVFSEEGFNELPPHRKWDHAIDLIPNYEEFNTRVYPLRQDQEQHLNKFIDDNLATGRIRISKSPVSSGLFFVAKKDGGWRPVQDYRELNKNTVKNSYPLPLISDLVDKLRHAAYFTKIDIRSGFNNIRIRKGDEWKGAFKCARGLFEPTVMFFGMCNSPATFQTMMDEILKECIDAGCVVVYVDDIMIFHADLHILRQMTKKVLDLLRKFGLYAKPEKCTFEATTVEFLGLVISKGQIRMDPVKVQGVIDWPAPKTLRQLRSFIGFLNFYRRFVKDFAKIAKPLNDLTKKDVKWSWSIDCQQAFDSLKEIITSAPVLSFPDHNKPKMIETDASKFAYGAILSQLEGDVWKPLAYMSRTMQPTETRYDVHDKELLAIVKALNEWQQYLPNLAGAPTLVISDHQNLQYFTTARQVKPRQLRWKEFLSGFNIKILYRPGKSSTKPDALSRRYDHDIVEDPKEEVILEPTLFANTISEAYFPDVLQAVIASMEVTEEPSLPKEIWHEQMKDPLIRGFLMIKESDTKVIPPGWDWNGEYWTKDGRMYVPAKVRHKVLRAHHDAKTAGHPGQLRTLELVSRDYWWPQMSTYVKTYVSTCDSCNRNKTFPGKPVGFLKPTEVPTRPWQHISSDLITQLPQSNGFDAILVIVCLLSKMLRLIPTTSDLSSYGMAKLFLEHVWRVFGFPEKVISDRGPQYASNFMRDLANMLGIKLGLSTAYHPQTDGQTERANQEVEQYLRHFVNEYQSDWADLLVTAEFSINNRVNASTKASPFQLVYGFSPRVGLEPRKGSKIEKVEEFSSRMQDTWKDTQAALRLAKEDMARFYNQRRKPTPDFSVGDKVWLDASNISTTRPTKKLDVKRLGPYPIVEKIGTHNYRLRLPKGLFVHPTFHVSRLRLYQEDPIPERHQKPPPPVKTKEGPAYEIEKLLKVRLRKRGPRTTREFLVDWKGYGKEERSWEPENHITKGAIKAFFKEFPDALEVIASIPLS